MKVNGSRERGKLAAFINVNQEALFAVRFGPAWMDGNFNENGREDESNAAHSRNEKEVQGERARGTFVSSPQADGN